MVAGGSGAGSGSAKVRKGFGSYEIMAGLGVSYEGCGLVNVGFEYINKWKCWGEQWYVLALVARTGSGGGSGGAEAPRSS